MTTTHVSATPARVHAPVQLAAMVFGLAFLAVGVAGFIPGITSHYSDMTFAGRKSGAMLLGLFDVSVLHNLVHLVFGVVGLALARAARSARAYLLVGGVIYLVLAVYGILIDRSSAPNFVPLNTADNWLHIALAGAMIVVSSLPPVGTAHQ